MRIRTLGRLALAATLAGAASFGAALGWYALTTEPERIFPHAEAEPESIRILVAKQRLPQGDILAAHHLQWVEWPVTAVPDGAFTSVEALFGADHKDRRFVRRTIEPGEPILYSKISEPNKAGSIKDELPPGYRAVSIAVDAVAIVSGFVSVGDRVDILLTHSPEGQLVSSVILQGIEILAIDQNFDSDRYDPKVGRTVTVLVTTRQAQLLNLARQRGRLSLVLPATHQVPRDAPERLISPEDFRPDPSRPFPPVLREYDDRPVHPMLLPPPGAVEDPAGDWVPGTGWPPLPGR